MNKFIILYIVSTFLGLYIIPDQQYDMYHDTLQPILDTYHDTYFSMNILKYYLVLMKVSNI